jgi:hypothetical protein
MLKNPKVTRNDVYFGGFNIEVGSKRYTPINHYYKNGNEILIPLPSGNIFKIFITFPTTNFTIRVFKFVEKELVEEVTYREDVYNFPDLKECYQVVDADITKYYFDGEKLVGIEIQTTENIQKGLLSIRFG